MGNLLEKHIETQILHYLEYLPQCFAWKNPTYRRYDKKKCVYYKAKSRYVISGVSDILGVYKGRFLAIEVKHPDRKNNVTLDQKRFLITKSIKKQIDKRCQKLNWKFISNKITFS